MADILRTFHERIDPCLALQATAEAFNRAQRFLLAQHGKDRVWTGDLAIAHYGDFGLPAKMWEYCWRDLKGKIASLAECGKLEKEKLERKVAAKLRTIAKAEKRLAKAEKTVAAQIETRRKTAVAVAAGKKPLKKAFDAVAHDTAAKVVGKTRFALHQHRRKLASLEHELVKADRPRTPCFGGRKLFAAQHDLAENGYASRFDWRVDWLDRRSNQFVVEGDAGKESGNGFIRVHPQFDGTFTVELRLPPAAARFAETCEKAGGTIVHSVRFVGLRFRHGAPELRRALQEKLPITWRFVRDGDSWRCFWSATFSYAEQKIVANDPFAAGVLGVDLNERHVVATQVDRFGNPVRSWRFPLVLYGLSETQREDRVRKVAADVVRLAAELKLPVVSETLDFTEKKAALRDTSGLRRARMLSSFGYRQFDRALASACVRFSVLHRRVDPAFTSVIGDLSYSRRYGLTVHAAAAAVIARRAMRLSERLPAAPELLRRRSGDRVALSRPAWNGERHVWSAWRELARRRQGALAGQSGPGAARPSESTAGVPPPAAKARSGGGG